MRDAGARDGVEWLQGDEEATGGGDRAGDAPQSEVINAGRGRPTSATTAWLSATTTRIPTRIRWVAALAVLIAVLAVVRAGATHAGLEPVRSGSAHPTAIALPGSQALALVDATARTPGKLTDVLRSDSSPGACVAVLVGQSPQSAVAAEVQRVLPGYAVGDVARTIDQFAALCAMTVRATDVSGSVLVVNVVAPDHAEARNLATVTVGTSSAPPRSVIGPQAAAVISMAQAVTTLGWTVTVGALGPVDDEPASTALVSLATAPALLW